MFPSLIERAFLLNKNYLFKNAPCPAQRINIAAGFSTTPPTSDETTNSTETPISTESGTPGKRKSFKLITKERPLGDGTKGFIGPHRIMNNIPENPYKYRYFLKEEQITNDQIKRALTIENASYMEQRKSEANAWGLIFRKADGDVGSTAVQVANTTVQLKYALNHFATHKTDKHAKRNIERLHVKRRKLMTYLRRTDFDMYRRVVNELGIRGFA